MIPFGVPPNVTGTAPCIAPESLQGSALDQRADLYSLGALAYYILTGRPGYAVTRLEDLSAAWATPLQRPQRIVDIPDELDELVLSLMSLDPMKRPNSAAEVIDRLSAIGQLEPDDAPAVARSFFTSAPLCGRMQQVEELQRRIRRTSRGKGGAMVLEGRSGTGKSRILTEAGLIAQTCGVTALHAIARGQHGASYALAYELIVAAQQLMPLEAEKADASEITWPRVQDRSAQRDPVEQRARLQQELRDVLMRIARERPVLITIDDLERVDEPSAALIAALAYEAAHVLQAECADGLLQKLNAPRALLGQRQSQLRIADFERHAWKACTRTHVDERRRQLDQLAHIHTVDVVLDHDALELDQPRQIAILVAAPQQLIELPQLL